ncbi:MAG: hypothetical protein H0U74_17775 [Bradymonadaceae bacterium]|nr:hypothetical protein [Lujinxingiaceae bacterium]
MPKAKWLTILGSLVGVSAVYMTVIRPRHMRWGATQQEIDRPMLGDELVNKPTYVTTRAITIDARPEDVWPWLVQMGEHRGGFYSYDLIDRLLGIKVHSAHRILPRFQHLDEGDALDLKGNMIVRKIEAGRALVIGPGKSVEHIDSTWSIALHPLGSTRTRLVSRVRPRFDLKSARALLLLLVLDIGQIIMEQKWLHEIKSHAEGTYELWPPESAPTLH